MIAPDTGGAGRMLFSWGGVRRYATGAASARVRVTNAADAAWTIAAVDEAGQPIVSVASLAHRGVEAEQLGARRGHDALFALEWRALDAPSPAAGTERIVEITGAPPSAADAETTGALDAGDATLVLARPRHAQAALALLQRWLAEERPEGTRLAVVTRGAVAVDDARSPIPPSRPSGAWCAAR